MSLDAEPMVNILRSAIIVGVACLSCTSTQQAPAHGSPDAAAPPPKDAPDASEGPYTVPASCQEGFCRIEPGRFTMGSKEGAWGHPPRGEDAVEVTLTRPFAMKQHEVTVAEWGRIGLPHEQAVNKDGTRDCTEPQCPVGNITWFDALAFANAYSERQTPSLPACYKLTDCTGTAGRGLFCKTVELTTVSSYDCTGYRLPTEAEWEYATRAGTATDFYDGNREHTADFQRVADPVLERIAWYSVNAGLSTHPVGLKKPNAWGLFDVAGNVAEWVYDQFTQAGYEPGPLTDPVGRSGFDERVNRGGLAWDLPMAHLSARRSHNLPETRGAGLGFRLARTLR